MNAILIKKIILTSLLLFFFSIFSIAQDEQNEKKNSNNFYFFYVDNSGGYKDEVLTVAQIGELKDKLNGMFGKSNSLFLAYTSNGSNGKIYTNPNTLAETALKKYLQKSASNPNYITERNAVKEFFLDYDHAIRQSIELNFFISDNGVINTMNGSSELPTAIFLPKELLCFFNNAKTKVSINYFLSKEILQTLGQKKTEDIFTFCKYQLNSNSVEYNFTFL